MNSVFQPDNQINLVSDIWPWAESSVEQVYFDFSLEQMGETPSHLKRVVCELYRVCRAEAEVKIFCFHPRHDDFVMNPMCVHRLSPEFFMTLSVSDNLNKIAGGFLGRSHALEWGVNFEIKSFKPHFSLELKDFMEVGKFAAGDLQEKMRFENNICHVMEFDLKVVKSK